MSKRNPSTVVVILLIYLCLIAIIGVYGVIAFFPKQPLSDGPVTSLPPLFAWLFPSGVNLDQRFILLACFAGIAGSFLQAAQSLTSFIGNKSFVVSWMAWYLLKPWIGAVLGIVLYVVMRAGIISSVDAADPYGVLALGFFGGWFSKAATDKLNEVFSTLFSTSKDEERQDKLNAPIVPILTSVSPNPVLASHTSLTLEGENFSKDALVIVDTTEYKPQWRSDSELVLEMVDDFKRPNGQAKVAAKNPGELDLKVRTSNSFL